MTLLTALANYAYAIPAVHFFVLENSFKLSGCVIYVFWNTMKQARLCVLSYPSKWPIMIELVLLVALLRDSTPNKVICACQTCKRELSAVYLTTSTGKFVKFIYHFFLFTFVGYLFFHCLCLGTTSFSPKNMSCLSKTFLQSLFPFEHPKLDIRFKK